MTGRLENAGGYNWPLLPHIPRFTLCLFPFEAKRRIQRISDGIVRRQCQALTPPLTFVTLNPCFFNKELAFLLLMPLWQITTTSFSLDSSFILCGSCCSGIFLKPWIWFNWNSPGVRTSTNCLFLSFN